MVKTNNSFFLLFCSFIVVFLFCNGKIDGERGLGFFYAIICHMSEVNKAK